jgi:hypothetical protein
MTKTEKEIKLLATKIDREADTIQIPKTLSLKDAVTILQKRLAEEEADVAINEVIEGFPFDAAHALQLVLHERYGFVVNEGGQGWFGPEPCPVIPVSTGPDSVVQVPFGQFKLPGISGTLMCGFAKVGRRVVFRLTGVVKGKHKSVVSEIAETVRDKLKTHSIYQGQAISITFRDEDGEKLEVLDPSVQPKFLHLDSPDPIFTNDTTEQIELGILNSIRHGKALKKAGESLRRSVLMEGPYGTGKTLTAAWVARECVANGWTFISLKDCRDLTEAMSLAEQYTPAVIFTEDVDRVMGGTRDAEMDQLSYALDGVDTKGKDVMIVLTTNNVQNIRKLMLRPGRIDTVVSVTNPDADTVYRLIKFYAGEALTGERAEYDDAIKPMVDQSPSFVAEVVKKAKLRAVTRPGKLQITADDVRIGARMMVNHVKLMNAEEPSEFQDLELGQMTVRVSR